MTRNPEEIVIDDRSSYDGLEPIYGPLPGPAHRKPVPCLGGEGGFVLVTLGQSNAANFVNSRYDAKHDVRNFSLYDGKCYAAADPLIGASGDGGNFATRLGDILIERGFAKQIVLAPIAMGNTRIENWSPGGEFNRRILVLIRRLHEARLTPNLILWQQGEGNAGDVDAGGENYRRHLLGVIQTFRDYGVSAPIMVALCTLCGDRHPNADCVRDGQRSVVSREAGIFLGPDTDLIGHEHRFDRCHMSASGAQMQAGMWAESIMSQMPSSGRNPNA